MQTPGPKTLVTRNYGLLHTVAGFVHAIRDSPRIVTRHTGHRWHNTSTICMDMNRSGHWEAQRDQCPNKFGTKKACSLIPCDDLRNMFVAKYYVMCLNMSDRVFINSQDVGWSQFEQLIRQNIDKSLLGSPC